jgi:hypothetical protein
MRYREFRGGDTREGGLGKARSGGAGRARSSDTSRETWAAGSLVDPITAG